MSDRSLQTFISYSRVNQQFALRLACELRSAGFSIWMDQFDIPTGSRWDEEIEKALRACQIFLFIMTPASVASENAKDEVGYAIDHGKRVLPVLLEKCEVPLRLRRMQYVDFTELTFNEGIKRATELLSRLVAELEASASDKAKSTPAVPRDPGSNEPVTAPVKRRDAPHRAPKKAKRSVKFTSSQWIAGGGILFIGLLVVAGLAFRPGLMALFASPSPTVTLTATETAVPPTGTATPTSIPDTPTPGIPRVFKEEFDPDSQWKAGWSVQLRHGSAAKQNNFRYEAKDGSLNFDLNNGYVWGYFLYQARAAYSHAVLQAVISNLKDKETFGLVCQFSDKGWYEFDILGEGKYYIRYVDSMDSDKDDARYDLASGFIPGFKDSFTAVRENLVKAECNGSRLILSVNGAMLKDVESKKFALEQGQVGFTARSYKNYPVQFSLKSFEVSEP